MIPAGAASNRCIPGAFARAPAAYLIGTAAAAGITGSDAVGVATTGDINNRCIGVFAESHTTFVVRVAGAGDAGGRCIA